MRAPGGRMRESVEMSVSDALDHATMSAHKVNVKVHPITHGKEGIKSAYDAARAAVADKAGDKIDEDVFGMALEASMDILDGSIIRRYRDIIIEELQDLIKVATELAARKGARDRTAEMPRRYRRSDRLLDAAVQAAKARLDQPDAAAAVQAAKKTCLAIAEITSRMITATIQNAIPPHAAAVAVFEVAIRDVPAKNLAGAIENVCQRMPKMASVYGPFNEQFAAATAKVILDKTRHCATHKAAVKAVDKYAVKETKEQIDSAVIQFVRGAVYKTAVAGAYDTADKKKFFESQHERALILACGLNPDRPESPVLDESELDPAVAEAAKEMMVRMRATFNAVMSDEDPDDIELFEELRGAQYKAAASGKSMTGFLSLYRMAHRAGYDSVLQ